MGQQACCATAFLLLLAAEWAASNRYKCISWEEISFFHCPMFCDEPLLLIQCATGDLFHSFILFIAFFKKLFLDDEGLNHGIFLQVIRVHRCGHSSCFSVPSFFYLFRTCQERAVLQIPSLLSWFFQTSTGIWVILFHFYSLTVDSPMQLDKE